jgi:diguanylate cyclase (GGDEF)-like protein/PAS domain S-box-containing protein
MNAFQNLNKLAPDVVWSSPLAIVVFDMNYSIQLWNPAAETLFGWKKEDVLGKPFPTVSAHEGEKNEFVELMESVKQEETLLIRRTRRPRKDGSILDVSISVSPLRANGSKVIGAIGIFADITSHKQSEDLYKTLAESSYAGVYVVQNGKFQFINRNAAAYAGYTIQEIIGRDADSVIHPDDKNLAKVNSTLMLIGKRISPYEFRIVSKNGQIRWIMETVTPICYNGENAILGNSMDITERRQMEQALRQNEERYRAILENIEDGYYEIDLQGNFVLFNDACEGIFGYRKAELNGMSFRQITDPETAVKVYEILNRVCTTGKSEKGAEWELVRKDGTKGYMEASISLIRDAADQPTGFRGIIHDVTARKEAERMIAHMAYHDHLTGLPNRSLFNDRLNVALAQSQRKDLNFALLILDLDGFKDVNDTFGHSMGDRILQSVGTRLSKLLRKSDTVARMGGDEFLILLQEISSPENAYVTVRKIMKVFQKPFTIGRRSRLVTTSIGMAVYPEDGEDAENLMKHADAALYRAKREGRNQYRRYLPLIDKDALPSA